VGPRPCLEAVAKRKNPTIDPAEKMNAGRLACNLVTSPTELPRLPML